MAWSRCIKNVKLLQCIIHKVTTSRHIGWCWAHQSSICFLFVVQLRICRLFRSILCPWIMYGSIISALFFNPKSSVSGTVSSCLFLWSFLSCHYFFNPVMKSWETFFMLNFIYFHLQIAIVKVLYEIRLLSGKSYRKYRCKWRWWVDSGKLWILDIEVINIFDSWFWINLDYNSSCCHSNLSGKERICSFIHSSVSDKFYLWCMFHYESTSTEIWWYSMTLTQGWRRKLCMQTCTI